MPLDPTAVAREVRSFLALEMAARKVLPPVQLLLGSTLLRACYARLHTIYMCVYKYTFASSSMHRFFQRASNMISQIWKSMLPESVKLEVSQYTTPDSWIQFVSRHEEHRAGPPIPPKNPITDVFMNGTGSWAPFDPFNYY